MTAHRDVCAYLGSMLAGEIETWGITSEEDFWPMELGYYRGCPDMARPQDEDGPRPAVIFIHGGGWATGHRWAHRSQIKSAAERGYVAGFRGKYQEKAFQATFAFLDKHLKRQ